MASDTDFNRKSFTTGHTGFGVPFATWPDRADVPRNAARSLRYMDRYLTVTQGEVFYVTEALAKLEGLERGPSGNTAMAAAVSLARDLPRDATVVVQETEYTGAGKHHWAQLNFARENGVEVRAGDPADNVPGKAIVIPERPEQIRAKDFDLGKHAPQLRAQRARRTRARATSPTAEDIAFLAEDTNSTPATVEADRRRELKEGRRRTMVREDTFKEVRAAPRRTSPTSSSRRASGSSRSEIVDRSSSSRARTRRLRSSARVLMRMGIDSPTCSAVVAECEKRGLLGHGAGHVVWRCMRGVGLLGAPRPPRGSPPARAGTMVEARWKGGAR